MNVTQIEIIYLDGLSDSKIHQTYKGIPWQTNTYIFYCIEVIQVTKFLEDIISRKLTLS